MTQSFEDPRKAAEWSAECRKRGQSVGFVPTMGALHAGHLELVKQSELENDVTCVSVFVNPLQFEESEDFAKYPRDIEKDFALLASVGCDLLFTGELTQFFPELDGDPAHTERIQNVDPGPRACGLEGAHRNGHFDGVAKIVRRLFELIVPTRAYFGEKDYQQSLVVEDLARALGYPVIRRVPTFREPSGLAYSSRNARLSEAERDVAIQLSRGLFAARDAWRTGERNAEALTQRIRGEFKGPGLEVEYVELRDPARWEQGGLTGEVTAARALVAARLGGVRLMDNLDLDETAIANRETD